MKLAFDDVKRDAAEQSRMTMKLHLHTSELNQITGCDAESISVNHQRYHANLIVSAETLQNQWFDKRWEELDAEALACLLPLQAEVILLGTGDKHRFIHPKHIRALLDANIAVECMTTAAACRTFNILNSEGRKVVAALLLEKSLSGRSV